MADRVNNPNMLINKDGVVLGIQGGWVFVDPDKLDTELLTTSSDSDSGSGSGSVSLIVNTTKNGKKIAIPSTVELPTTPGWVWTGSEPAPTTGSWYVVASIQSYVSDRQKTTDHYVIDSAYWIGPGVPDVYPNYIANIRVSVGYEQSTLPHMRGKESPYKILKYKPPTWLGASKASLSWIPKKFGEIPKSQYTLDYPPLPPSLPPPPLSDLEKKNKEKKEQIEALKSSKVYAIARIYNLNKKIRELKIEFDKDLQDLNEKLAEEQQNLSSLNTQLSSIPTSGGYRKKTLRRRSIKHRRKTVNRSHR